MTMQFEVEYFSSPHQFAEAALPALASAEAVANLFIAEVQTETSLDCSHDLFDLDRATTLGEERSCGV